MTKKNNYFKLVLFKFFFNLTYLHILFYSQIFQADKLISLSSGFDQIKTHDLERLTKPDKLHPICVKLVDARFCRNITDTQIMRPHNEPTANRKATVRGCKSLSINSYDVVPNKSSTTEYGRGPT